MRKLLSMFGRTGTKGLEVSLSVRNNGLKNGVSDRRPRVMNAEEEATFIEMVKALR